MGLRATARDAFCAYLASLGSCAADCQALDPHYDGSGGVASHPGLRETVATLNQHLQEPLTVERALQMKQKALTLLLDAHSWDQHLSSSCPTARAILLSEAEPGARAFLAATPAGRRRMDGPLFITELRQRLGMPDCDKDAWCPRCDGILDIHSLHAATCAAGGERTQRHHALRDLLFDWARRAGLQPEREKSGLLLPQCPEEVGAEARRPADIFLPALSGFPTALDLAVTAPQRQETLARAAQTALSAASSYTQTKATHLNTAAACEQQGVKFVPLVVESTGAWDPSASRVLQVISRATAARLALMLLPCTLSSCKTSVWWCACTVLELSCAGALNLTPLPEGATSPFPLSGSTSP